VNIRRVMWVLIGTTLAILAIAMPLVKYTIAPAIIRHRIKTTAKDHWKGPVAVEGVHFSFLGPTRLERLVLADWQGRRWVEADAVTVLSRGGRFEANHVTINAHVDGRRMSMPLKAVDRSTGAVRRRIGSADPGRTDSGSTAGDKTASDRPTFKNLVVHNLEVSAWDGGQPLKILDRAAAAIVRRRDYYEVLVFEKSDAAWQQLSIGGRINANDGRTALHVGARRFIKPEEGAFFVRLWNWPGEWTAGGQLEISGTLSGDIQQPAKWTMDGTARLTDWSIHAGRHSAISDLDMLIRMQGRRYEVHDFACTVYDGRLQGTLWAVTEPEGLRLGGEVSGDGLSAREIAVEMGAQDRISRGAASGRVQFAMNGGLETLHGRAVLLFRETSLSMFPLSMKIMVGMGLDVSDPHQAADMACAFDFVGTSGTIRQGRFVNSAAAMETQAGGSLNVATGQVDLRVVAVPLEPAVDEATAAPSEVKEKVQCLHVAGSYWDPPSKLITRESAGDVSAETIDFLQDTIQRRRTAGHAIKRLGRAASSTD
jgi:hypothetical protein